MSSYHFHAASTFPYLNQLRVLELTCSFPQAQGLVNVPFWEYWTSPKIVAIIDIYRPLIPNGWVMFNGDMTNDPCFCYPSIHG